MFLRELIQQKRAQLGEEEFALRCARLDLSAERLEEAIQGNMGVAVEIAISELLEITPEEVYLATLPASDQSN